MININYLITANGVQILDTPSKADYFITDNDLSILIKSQESCKILLDSLGVDKVILCRIGNKDKNNIFIKDDDSPNVKVLKASDICELGGES